MPLENRTALRDLRRTRQRRRLGETEWFDVAYRVYLFALVGLTAVVLASDAVRGFITDDVSTDDLVARGPAIAGVAVMVAFAAGVRSGANGGPISIEVADIRHVLLAPIGRRTVLVRPIAQRFRSTMFSFGLTLGILGQLVATELEGSRAAWAAAGAMFGSVIGSVFVASAVIAHAVRLPRWTATVIAVAGVAWQSLAAWTIWDGQTSSIWRFGPANLEGSLAFWGIRQRGIDTVALAVMVIVIVFACLLGGRLRLEPLARRGELVSQLRFAATVQDLRTVVMLRKQLRAETLRARPWGARRSPAGRPHPSAHHLPTTSQPSDALRKSSVALLIWIRGIRSLRRLPASRLARIALLAVGGGVSASLTVSSSLLCALGTLVAVFLIGMEAIEPLSQEIDRPDLTDTLPIERGTLFAHHLVAPGLLIAVAALIGAGAASIVDVDHAAAAFAIAITIGWGGAIGPVVGAILDSPSPISVQHTTITGKPSHQEGLLIPPEFAGFTQAFSTLLPVVLSAFGVLPLIAMRADPTAATAIRSFVGTTLALGFLTLWIRRRDRWGVAIRSFFEAGRAQQTEGSAT